MIDPLAVQLGPIEIKWYGIIMALAFAAGTLLAFYRAKQTRVDPDHILNMIILVIPSSIIMARLFYVLFQWPDYQYQPLEIFAFWHGGLSIHGGLTGGILAGVWHAYSHKLPIGVTADVIAPSIILGQAIGRWGNFFNREAYGDPAGAVFMSHFPAFIRDQMFINGQYHHPAFLYESIWNFVVFAFLLWYSPRRGPSGELFLLYLTLYSVGRFLVEGIRADSLMWGPFKAAQLASLVIVIACAVFIFYLRKKNLLKHKETSIYPW